MASEMGQKRLSFSIESILSEDNNSKSCKPTYSPYRSENDHSRLPCYGTESFEEHLTTEGNGKKVVSALKKKKKKKKKKIQNGMR